jgi:two-component system, cell cycle sensor histidine kinase PleC
VDERPPGEKQPSQRAETGPVAPLTLPLGREALGNLAHELRTPIQVLIGYLDILRDELNDELGPRARDVIERMQGNVHDLAQTIDNLIEFVLTEAHAQSNLDENFSIGSLIGDVQPVIEAANLKKHLTLRFDLSEAPSAIRAPRRPLRSIILNLALNAIKFTERGSVTVAIREATMAGRSGAIEIEVSDSGAGLSQEMLEEARKPFVQLSQSNARTHRGLGLGLAMVQRYVAALGGSLELRSEDQPGAKFVVRIPVRPLRAARRGAAAIPPPPPAPRKTPPGARR